jgi:hypothetical protein
MGFTDKFRVQHNDILAIAQEMGETLKTNPEPALLRKQLSNLAGKLNFHLAMEDQALYPRLMQHKDSQARVLATKFMREMGGLGDTFSAYNAKWQISAIRSSPAQFAAETQQVFAALSQRIARENKELYPLADKQA